MKKNYTRFDDRNLTARYLLELGAVHFRPEEPFRFTSGRKSPVYVDVRCICGTPHARANIIAMACSKVFSAVGARNFRVVAGGETAGIPIAAWVADRMDKPMAYVRKEPKEFGRGGQIEGLSETELAKGQRFLLCEDLITDGGSKKMFIDAIRRSGNIVTDCLVIYSYGCFGAEERLQRDGVTVHSITDAATLVDVAEDLALCSPETITGVREFIADPDGYYDHKEGDGVETIAFPESH